MVSLGLNNQRGYTIVELVSLILIIGVLTVLLVSSTRVGDRRQVLRDQTSVYVNAVREAETYALSSKPVSGASRPSYGVCLTSSSSTDCSTTAGSPITRINVFARTNPAQALSATPPGSAVVIIKSTQLNDKVSVTTGQSTFVEYAPLSGKLYVNGSNTTNSELVFNYTGETSYTRTVALRPLAGAVYAQ
jgi:type II secretory pathway pseudopilin PulG